MEHEPRGLDSVLRPWPRQLTATARKPLWAKKSGKCSSQHSYAPGPAPHALFDVVSTGQLGERPRWPPRRARSVSKHHGLERRQASTASGRRSRSGSIREAPVNGGNTFSQVGEVRRQFLARQDVHGRAGRSPSRITCGPKTVPKQAPVPYPGSVWPATQASTWVQVRSSQGLN
jgi:hypothetical protein